MVLIKKLASYANLEFSAKYAMRQSTCEISRLIVVCGEDDESIILPRSIEGESLNILDERNIRYLVNGNRHDGKQLQIKFNGRLTDRQEEAFLTITKGVLDTYDIIIVLSRHVETVVLLSHKKSRYIKQPRKHPISEKLDVIKDALKHFQVI